MQNSNHLMTARDVSCIFGHGKNAVAAVDNVSFHISSDEIVSIVGESGSGKTSLARLMLRLYPITSGDLHFKSTPVTEHGNYWRWVQAVFQDPFSSFNQFFTVRSQMKSCFKLLDTTIPEQEKQDRIDKAFRMVNLDPGEIKGKFPFELSGGQMQRLLLARIFLIRPSICIADEPTSMIDACSRATILELLLDLKRELAMSIIFITHDIGLAYHVSDRIFVMRRGAIVEQGVPDNVILNPQHEYTKKLLKDIPVLNREWI
ncbi:MAG: ATP-binding cassette domain-containing protein [Chitinivibrionales bacterium]|nr:ATP-binding cassette domain-containing protein [Chitinivibrionales bacterium]